jgi:hypothetical protein
MRQLAHVAPPAADQLALFAEAESGRPRRRTKGPRGLLLALVQQGLDEGALKVAAALVLELDDAAQEGVA